VLYVGICSNREESAEELATFARNRGMIFTIYRDPQGTIARRLGLSTVPAVALLDQAGTLVHGGGLETSGGRLALDVSVNSALAKKTAAPEVVPTPIDRPGPRRVAEDPYGAPAFSSELIFERIPGTAAFHCSTITEAANGDLLCLWYGGSFESADDQTLFLARRRRGERDWQAPQPLIRGPQPLP
jgi:hypothetical protein